MRSRESVSVVVPTYQRRDVVVQALGTVFEQTHPPLEVIVVDDGSNDGTAEAVRALGRDVDYVWQPNAGVSAARNAGLARARGSAVAFLDSDDRWRPSHLESLTATLAAEPDAVLAVSSPHPHIPVEPGATLLDALPWLLSGLGLLGNPSQVLVRREAVAAAGGFDERLPVAEDSELWVRLAAGWPFAIAAPGTAVRRKLPDSLQTRGCVERLFPPAYLRLAESGVAAAERRGGGADLLAHAHGGRAFARALTALAQGDAATARDRLREACTAAPRLSTRPDLVLNRIVMAAEPARRRWAFATAAAVWPDPGSPTARALDHYARRARLLDDVEVLGQWSPSVNGRARGDAAAAG